MKIQRIVVFVSISALLAINSTSTVFASSDAIVSANAGISTGVFAHLPPQVASALASSTTKGYCQLNATNVHFSNSTPGSIAADALVQCFGASIRISSITVTLHKSGEIQHYLTGPTTAGYASTGTDFQYNNFKVNCPTTTLSTYWSTAIAYGTYNDGSSTSATATSPTIQLACGTPW